MKHFPTPAALIAGMLFIISPLPADTSEDFHFSFIYSPTPVEHSLGRYSEFAYEIRKRGEREFTKFYPVLVSETKDRGVQAEFKINIPQPKTDEIYEIRTSYILDGKFRQNPMTEQVLIGSIKHQERR